MDFIQVFGERYLALVDTANLYARWRVPNPQAPYPQDDIIDQQGIVRYWNDEYDPQAIIATIDALLASGVKTPGHDDELKPRELSLRVAPNPTQGEVLFSAAGFSEGRALVRVLDIAGRMVQCFTLHNSEAFHWKASLPVGVYFVTLESAGRRCTQPLVVTR
jgi:hypothetical protein